MQRRHRHLAEVLHRALPDGRRLRREPMDRGPVVLPERELDLRTQGRGREGVPGQQSMPVEQLLGRNLRMSPPVFISARGAAVTLLLGATFVMAAPEPARAGEKIAVLVLATADKDADLADNLTEVIIAYAAQHGGFEIAGKEEFRARLGVESERRTQACLDDTSCLGRAGVSLGV